MERVAIIGVGLRSVGGNLNQTWDRILTGENAQPYIVRTKSSLYRLYEIADAAVSDTFRSCSFEKAKQPDALLLGSSSASFSEVERGLECVPSYIVEALAKNYGIPTYTQVSQACAASGYAIALGVDMIRSGRVEIVLAGGADELTQCVAAAFKAVRLYADACKPFDLLRRGLVLGEAAAFILMARVGIGEPLCYITGVGLTCDAFDSVAPSREGIHRAISEAMTDAKTSQVDFVIAHGTGTKLGDWVETDAIYDARSEIGTPIVASYKGSLGHPQGASGAVSVALAVKALQCQIAFPTDFEVADPEIKVPIARRAVEMTLNRVLCLNSGSWGANAAIVLSRTGVE